MASFGFAGKEQDKKEDTLPWLEEGDEEFIYFKNYKNQKICLLFIHLHLYN